MQFVIEFSELPVVMKAIKLEFAIFFDIAQHHRQGKVIIIISMPCFVFLSQNLIQREIQDNNIYFCQIII